MNKWGERKREKEKRKQPMLVATRPRMVGGIIIVLSTLGSVVIGMPLSIISSMSCPQHATTDKRKKEKKKKRKKKTHSGESGSSRVHQLVHECVCELALPTQDKRGHNKRYATLVRLYVRTV